MAEATRPTTGELITYLNPRELIPNPRTNLGDLVELTASIRQGGCVGAAGRGPVSTANFKVLRDF